MIPAAGKFVAELNAGAVYLAGAADPDLDWIVRSAGDMLSAPAQGLRGNAAALAEVFEWLRGKALLLLDGLRVDPEGAAVRRTTRHALVFVLLVEDIVEDMLVDAGVTR